MAWLKEYTIKWYIVNLAEESAVAIFLHFRPRPHLLPRQIQFIQHFFIDHVIGDFALQ